MKKTMEKINEMSKVEVLTAAGTANTAVKYGSMAVAIGTYVAKVAKIPVISTGICFASVIADSVINHLIVKNALTDDEDLLDELDELYDEFEEEVKEEPAVETLKDIAEEVAGEEEAEQEEDNFKEVQDEETTESDAE